MNQKIRIQLRGYDHRLLDQSTREIVDTLKKSGNTVNGPIPLPTKRTVVTVNRSVHADKKSREQFEVRVHKRLLEVLEASAKTIEALNKLELAAGIDVEIKS